jgi:hypothetical protein
VLGTRTTAVHRPARASFVVLAIAFVALLVTMAPPKAEAANGSCIAKGSGFRCEWNCNPQAGESWCWFDSGGENARNWFFNDASDSYSSHVFKCAAAIRADNGNTWASQCGASATVSNSYPRCNCGGLYVRTWNNASGSRNLFSSGES